MAVKDYYSILQLEPTAPPSEIDAAYKRLAKACHPDVSRAEDAHEQMILLNQAYEVLGDPDRRRRYDAATGANSFALVSEPPSQPRVVPPPRPTPGDFSIRHGYYDWACEGSKAWQIRRRMIGSWAKALIRLMAWTIGGMISMNAAVSSNHGANLWAWLALPVVAELALYALAQIDDRRQMLRHFLPTYSANPAGYVAYEDAARRYDRGRLVVHVVPGGAFHLDPKCGGVQSGRAMPYWAAERLKLPACPLCGGIPLPAIPELPHPFGQAEPTFVELPNRGSEVIAQTLAFVLAAAWLIAYFQILSAAKQPQSSMHVPTRLPR